jgi:C4-dicarboxylate-specific signal transduction histidine kinase
MPDQTNILIVDDDEDMLVQVLINPIRNAADTLVESDGGTVSVTYIPGDDSGSVFRLIF